MGDALGRAREKCRWPDKGRGGCNHAIDGENEEGWSKEGGKGPRSGGANLGGGERRRVRSVRGVMYKVVVM
eukprot:768504-Hanusia_phi.AAC.5